MATAKKNGLKKSPKQIKAPNLSVVTVRISDEEKERIDTIMKNLNIKRYSDVMRLALQMVQQEQFTGYFG